MNISIICPLYKAEPYIRNLHESLRGQINVDIKAIKYILTESNDRSEDILKELDAEYKKIPREQFSHSKVREEAACEADGDIVVFITQDVIIRDNRWLEKLVAPIVGGEAEACFSRQLCENSSIEKYIREKNYPAESRVVTKNDIKALGLGTFFFSDVSSAMERKMFLELNGYDRKDLITNEDMYICHKLITNGYRVKYCADSVVVHSHTFTFMQLLRRYFDTGVFMKQNEYFLQYGANKSGLGLLKYVLKRAFEEKNLRVALTAIPNFAARFIGMALGKRYNVLSRKVNIFLASNKSYWLSQDC